MRSDKNHSKSVFSLLLTLLTTQLQLCYVHGNVSLFTIALLEFSYDLVLKAVLTSFGNMQWQKFVLGNNIHEQSKRGWLGFNRLTALSTQLQTGKVCFKLIILVLVMTNN